MAEFRNRQAFLHIWYVLGALFSALCFAAPAQAQAVWEDYQGTQGILGTSNNDKPGPAYDNNVGYTVAELSALRTISATISNATRTGTSTTIDYRQAGDVTGYSTLCNSTNPTAGTGYDATGLNGACLNDSQGRVVYALIKFPFTGNYTFSIAHDDAIDLDLSTDYSNTNYRTAAYNLPVGDAASFTADENTYDTLAGIFSSPTANACILMRLYWNNNGGRNYLRVRWARPTSNSNNTPVTEIVPAAYFFDPGNPASSVGCTAITPPSSTSITCTPTP